MKKILTEEQAAVRGGARRRTGAGTYTVVLSLIVLAVLAVINLLVSALPARFTDIDISANKMYSISESSEKAARKVKEDVTIYLISDSSQGENNQMETFLARFAEMNSHIKLRVIDPVTSPNFTSQYTDKTLTNLSVIVESARRHRVVDYGEMAYLTGGISASADAETLQQYIQYFYQMYGEYPELYFNGENLIVSALDYVTTAQMPTAYTLTGHGETALSDTLKKQLDYNNITAGGSFASLTATALPADCNILIINAPTSDINTAEAQMIIAYMQAGGNVLMTTAPGISKLPNLLSVAQAMGLDAADGMIIEQNADNFIPNYPYYLLPTVEEHELTAALGQGYYMFVPMAHGIVRAAEVPAGVTIAPLFSTSSSAYAVSIESSSIAKPEDAAERSFWVGATATGSAGGHLIWLSSSLAVSDEANSTTGANYSYVSAMATWLCPRETILETVAPISMSEPVLVVPAGTALTLSAVLILVIPAIFAVTGLVIWIRRRRR